MIGYELVGVFTYICEKPTKTKQWFFELESAGDNVFVSGSRYQIWSSMNLFTSRRTGKKC